MIRWYDWAVAVFCADLIVALSITTALATTVLQAALSSALVFALFVAWDDWCQFRLKQESERDD